MYNNKETHGIFQCWIIKGIHSHTYACVKNKKWNTLAKERGQSFNGNDSLSCYFYWFYVLIRNITAACERERASDKKFGLMLHLHFLALALQEVLFSLYLYASVCVCQWFNPLIIQGNPHYDTCRIRHGWHTSTNINSLSPSFFLFLCL